MELYDVEDIMRTHFERLAKVSFYSLSFAAFLLLKSSNFFPLLARLRGDGDRVNGRATHL